MSKILKHEKKFNVIVPDLSPLEEEAFKAIFLEKPSEQKPKTEKKKKKEEIEKKFFERGYKLGYIKGYEKGKERGFKRGYEEGLEKGYKEGFLRGEEEAKNKYFLLERNFQTEYKNKIQGVESFLKNLEKEVNQLVINLDKEVLNLALKVAQKMVLKEVSYNSEITLNIIREALNYLAEGIEITIKVNPEEWNFLKEIWSQVLSPSQKINIIPDESISKGGVFIETSIGVIEATLEKRWEKILEALEKDES